MTANGPSWPASRKTTRHAVCNAAYGAPKQNGPVVLRQPARFMFDSEVSVSHYRPAILPKALVLVWPENFSQMLRPLPALIVRTLVRVHWTRKNLLEWKTASDADRSTRSDLIGFFRSMVFAPGPIFANILLADEINRATPKTQSALLEAMQEHQATIEGDTRPLPAPFSPTRTGGPRSPTPGRAQRSDSRPSASRIVAANLAGSAVSMHTSGTAGSPTTGQACPGRDANPIGRSGHIACHFVGIRPNCDPA